LKEHYTENKDAIELKKNEITAYFNSVYRETFNNNMKKVRRHNSFTTYERKDYEQIIRLHQDNEYILEIQKREKELQMEYNIYDEQKLKYEIQIKANEEKFHIICQDIRTLSENLKHLQDRQVSYYRELLKQGIDVRREGLCWIVKNLIELNAIIENSIFPKFLEHAHIEYLTVMSKKCVEIMQLEIMLKCLKDSTMKRQSYNEFSYIHTPSRKFKNTPKYNKRGDSDVDVFKLINYESLQDEQNVDIIVKGLAHKMKNIKELKTELRFKKQVLIYIFINRTPGLSPHS
jgi:hypothetical protein